MTSDTLAARGAPERIWAFGSRCTQNRLLGTAFAGTPYILATPTALAASPEVQALIAAERGRIVEIIEKAEKPGNRWISRKAVLSAIEAAALASAPVKEGK